MKVCLFLRVSTSHQTTDNQEMELLQLCERRGFNIVETYRETISGTKNNDDRKEFKRMMNDLKKRKFDKIVCYSLDRLGETDMVEGGFSLTLGSEYSIDNSNNDEVFKMSFANVLRNTKDNDLPEKSTLGNKRSDIIGSLKFKPSNYFDLEYEFSLDKNLRYSNLDIVKTNFTINNFVTSFEYLEEDNIIGDKSYIINKSKLNFDNNSSITFETSKNLDKNITDYYNLIYEYKNDCLSAAIEYNKTFYQADDLETDQNMFD